MSSTFASMAAPMQTVLSQDNISSEQEQDANLAFSELDKGLRSPKIGIQCESIVRFPSLFEKYPFPILINTAFLRLADIFRNGNNFLRWCILQVTEQSKKHLEKILNIDEFVRKIFSVIHSNDCTARALTLRTLANLASIITERKNVHHSIVNGFDSNDAVEVDAAVFAAGKFAEQSSSFAASICNNLSDMIQNIATPVDLKLQLIPILQHMYHDMQTSSKARQVCLELLSSLPSQKFVIRTLQTMTALACQSLIDVQSQVDLLISRVIDDPRQSVKLIALKDLNRLAMKAPQMWKYSSVKSLITVVLQAKSTAVKIAILEVLGTLAKSVAFHLFLTHDVSAADMQKIQEVCNLCYVSQNPTLSAKAMEFYTNIAICFKSFKRKLFRLDQDPVEGARLAITTQCCLSVWGTTKEDKKVLKLCLQCAVHLVKKFPDTTMFFLSEIVELLETTESEEHALILCEGLAAIGSENHIYIREIIPNILSLLQSSAICQEGQVKTYLGTLIFQAAGSESIPTEIQKLILRNGHKSPWFMYKLARQAMRYGQHPVAADLFSSLSHLVASEHLHFWMVALQEISEGESYLMKEKDDSGMTKTLLCYQKSLSSLKAASTQVFPMQFQTDLVHLRIELLQALTQLIQTCNTFRTCPPPAIATALALTNGQEISRCGQILSQLTKCMRDFENLKQKFGDLYLTCFDADPQTLYTVTQLQYCCEVMKAGVSSVITTDNSRLFPVTSENSDVLSVTLVNIQKDLNHILKTNSQALTHEHMDFLSKSVQSLLQVPFRYPRYFFQSIQTTKLNLAVTPQQNMRMEPLLVHHNTLFTLKVEGVIEHKKQMFRQVSQICIAVKTEITNQQHNTDTKVKDPNRCYEETVRPHKDYFSCSFLLSFPVAGQYSVQIRGLVLDDAGTKWNTGPQFTMTFKSYDDTIHRKPKIIVSRTSFGQM
ncbi:integrator complex subunit 7-like [Mytilus edulis]|uniref:integrator complex subunit 7-like n=1 Tax=Mytilus edulis TaxID=6550 RepID=UPI0039EE7E71